MSKKIALVTGASGGIGQAITRRLSTDGFAVCLHYHKNEHTAKALADELNAQGGRAVALCADLTDEAQAQALVAECEKTLGEVDVLVNNAGISKQGLLTDLSAADWKRMFGVHVDGAFYLSRAVLPAMIRKKAGRIIQISSMWGISGGSCEVAYSAAKAALIGFTKALAKEVGPSGITVNCIAPGVIDTPMNAHLGENDLAALADETPLCRIGTPAEVADAVAFFAGNQSTFITGQVLAVDGGITV